MKKAHAQGHEFKSTVARLPELGARVGAKGQGQKYVGQARRHRQRHVFKASGMGIGDVLRVLRLGIILVGEIVNKS